MAQAPLVQCGGENEIETVFTASHFITDAQTIMYILNMHPQRPLTKQR